MSVAEARAVEVQLKSILVATDFSPVSERALRHALVVAHHYGSKLYLMHVVSSLGFTLAGPDSITSAGDLAWKDLKRLEQRLESTGASAGLNHELIVRDGEIWEQIDAIVKQRHIEMIVVGTHSRTGFSKLVLGSVAEQIFRHATCPVLTVGPCCPTEPKLNAPELTRPILFPTDFTDDSLRALPHAVSFANEQQTRLVLLHVLGPVPQVLGNRWYTAEDVTEMRKAAKRDCLDRLHKLAGNIGLAIDPICMAEYGDYGAPADFILRAAAEVDAEAIIMGLKRKNHIDTISHLTWSTAYNVICRARSAVLTVRA